MQKQWELIDDQTGVVLITILADTGANGVTISNTPNWHSPSSLEKVTSLLGTANQWLSDNKEIP